MSESLTIISRDPDAKWVSFCDGLRHAADKLEKRAVWYEATGNAYMASEMRRRAGNKRRLVEQHENFGK